MNETATDSRSPDPASTAPDKALSDGEAELRRYKRYAAILLIASAGVYAGIAIVPEPGFWLRMVGAGAEAGVIGGLADWFAVTALFRHPLGIPIPHTALIPRNKMRLAHGLAGFIDANFLDPDRIGTRVAARAPAASMAQWLSNDRNTLKLAKRFSVFVADVLNRGSGDRLTLWLVTATRERLRQSDWAGLLAAGLRFARDRGDHEWLLDRLAQQGRDLIAEHREEIRAKISEQTGWWVPQGIDRRLTDRLIAGLEGLLNDLASGKGPARPGAIAALDRLIERLETDQALRSSIEVWVSTALDNPAVLRPLAEVWSGLRARAVLPDGTPGPELEKAIFRALNHLASVLRSDPEFQRGLDGWVEGLVRRAVVPWRVEIRDFIIETVAAWDAQDLSARVETGVGRDLQYIRINGTVLGALIGCGLFLLSAWVLEGMIQPLLTG